MRQDGRDISHVITIGETSPSGVRRSSASPKRKSSPRWGMLAAGVMHEINNPLATILACCEALTLRTETWPRATGQGYDEYLKIIDAEVQRCRRIVEGLLDFSRPKGGDKGRRT